MSSTGDASYISDKSRESSYQLFGVESEFDPCGNDITNQNRRECHSSAWSSSQSQRSLLGSLWWQQFFQRLNGPFRMIDIECLRQGRIAARKEATATATAPSMSDNAEANFVHVFPLDQIQKAIQIATIFLKDYERRRPPTLPATSPQDLSEHILALHHVRFSFSWLFCRATAVGILFGAACLDLSPMAVLLHLSAFAIFFLDMNMRQQIGLKPEPLRRVMLAWMAISCIEMSYYAIRTATAVNYTANDGNDSSTFTLVRPHLWITSAFKPVVLFYTSDKAQKAFLSVARIVPTVTRVLTLELFVILAFAAVACHLYAHQDGFNSLPESWLSLFQLSTTVVNPSLWMPLYKEDKSAAFFFVFFDATTTLYLHSLVLSVVFQTYIQASAEIHDKSIENREETLQYSFQALCQAGLHPSNFVATVPQIVSTDLVRRVLVQLRPHYSPPKIKALVDMYDPECKGHMDYTLYRQQIQYVLNASIRRAPTRSLLAFTVKGVAIFVAVANLIYVLALSSLASVDLDASSSFVWHQFIWPFGWIITALGILELMIRADPTGLLHFTPSTKLNGTFDGIAAVAALVSLLGLMSHQIKWLVIGRAMDLLRILRLQRIFRDVIRRSSEVFPALIGPLSMLFASSHCFAYVGMALWGGAIEVGQEGSIESLYDQNNFNTYPEAMLTMFNLLITNDWHAIANVYMYSARHSNPFVVCSFFVLANLICVSIMLNCVTAFFVGAFVAKLEEEQGGLGSELRFVQEKPKEFQINPSSRSPRCVSSTMSQDNCSLTTTSAAGEIEFDVYERPTYDKIMRTVAGGDSAAEAYSRDIYEKIETFYALLQRDAATSSGKEIGFLVYCQQTQHRYGNGRFEKVVEPFLTSEQARVVVHRLHAQIFSRDHLAGPNIETETFQGCNGTLLVVTVSLIRQAPQVSLVIATAS